MKAGFKYLLDTHAFLWAAVDDQRLGAKAARAVSTTAFDQLAISDITLQEIGLLLQAGRFELKPSPATALELLLGSIVVLPITLEIAIAAPALRLPHGDQFDRIIVATAQFHRVSLVTKDANIADSGLVTTIW